jgi:DNA-binding MarR family transcriptional regulator
MNAKKLKELAKHVDIAKSTFQASIESTEKANEINREIIEFNKQRIEQAENLIKNLQDSIDEIQADSVARQVHIEENTAFINNLNSLLGKGGN